MANSAVRRRRGGEDSASTAAASGAALSASASTERDEGFSHDEVFARYKEQLPTNNDHTAARKEKLFPMPESLRSWFRPMLESPDTDMICLELMFNVTVVLVPSMIFNFFLPLLARRIQGNEWYAANYGKVYALALAIHIAMVLLFYQRFILTLHVTAHRRLFKRKYDWLNSYNELVLCPFVGMPPGFYHLHHVCMHHSENNVFPYDISSTMPHQRDSVWALLSYIRRYVSHAVFYLPFYAVMKGRYRLALYSVACLGSWLTAAVWMFKHNPEGTVITMILPFCLTAVLLMQGNFTQHMFINPETPFDNFSLAFNSVSCFANQLTYNDGYHIIHHMNSRMHWSKMPRWFEENIERFAKTDALVFHSIDNNMVFYYAFTGQYGELYKYWIQLAPQRRSPQEFEALCRSRLKPLYGEPGKGEYAKKSGPAAEKYSFLPDFTKVAMF